MNAELRERLIRNGSTPVASYFSQDHIFSRVEQKMLRTIVEKQKP